MNRFAYREMLTFCLLAFGIDQVPAHSTDEHAGHGMAARKAGQETARIRIADVALLDQNGNVVSLEKDLVNNKIVVMGFIYTN